MSKDQVYDPVRNKWTEATPEEVIRQKWIEVMLNHLGFPKAGLVIEKKIGHLPHLEVPQVNLPNRRIDLLAYYVDDHKRMKPLLLIECKAIPLNSEALVQVMGYRDLIGVPFVALANEDEIRVCFMQKGELHQVPFLPDYRQLVQRAQLKAVISSNDSP